MPNLWAKVVHHNFLSPICKLYIKLLYYVDNKIDGVYTLGVDHNECQVKSIDAWVVDFLLHKTEYIQLKASYHYEGDKPIKWETYSKM